MKTTSAILAWLALVSTSLAQTNALTLSDAKRLAFQNNWDFLAAKSEVDISTAQRIVAQEFPNPALSLGTSKIGVDEHAVSTPQGNGFWDRNYDTILAIGQLFEIGGKRRARKDAAAAGWNEAQARLADGRRLLDQAVTQAYVAAVLAERNQQVLADSAASLRKEAKIAEAREHAGEISAADKNQIELAAARLELDARASANTARTARIQLEVLLGERAPRGQARLAETLEEIAAGVGEEKEPDSFARGRADLMAVQAAGRKAEAEVRLQKAQRIPDPTFSLQYEHEPPDQPNTIGLAVSFPLPLWNRNRGNIAVAEAAAREAATRTEKLRAQIVADIATARSAFDMARERAQLYRDELVPKSQQVREAVAFAYQKGGASLLDLLTSQRNDNEVRLASAQATADLASAAAALKAALGATRETNPVNP